MEKLKGKIATILVSLSIVLSAFMSAGSIYIEKSKYLDSASLYLQVSVFLLLGFIITVSFWTIEDTVKKHKNWQIPIILALFLSVLWIFVSPKQNAFFFNNREAVISEIKEQYKNIEETVTPFVDRYKSYKKISYDIDNIETKLKEMQVQQGKTGEGDFYHMLKQVNTELPKITDDFKNSYNRRTDKKIRKLEEELAEIGGLEYKLKSTDDNDNKKRLDSPDLITSYNESRLKIQRYISDLKDSDDPTIILENILNKLTSFQNLVQHTKETTPSERIKKIAEDTLTEINPLIASFSMKVKQADNKTAKLQASIDHVDKVVFKSITLNVALVDKHWRKYYPTYIGAQLLDYIPIAFMFFRIIMLIRDRKKLYLVADKEKLEEKYSSEIKKLEKIEECRTKNCKELKKYKALLESKEKEKSDSLNELEKEYDTEVDKLKDSINMMTIKMRNDIVRLEEEEKNKEYEAGDSYSKLQKIRDDYLTLKGKTDRDYNNAKDLINNQIEDRNQDCQRETKKLEDNFMIEINNIKDKINEMEERRKVRIANLKEEIDELEEDIKELDEQIKEIEIVDFKIREDRKKQNEE